MHVPVLVKEVLDFLNPKINENFIDATVGGGGHAIEILKKTSPVGKLLGIDLDKNQIRNSRESLSDYKERIVFVNDSYSNIKTIVEETRFNPIDGILLDLGFSSWHIDQSGRGFTFQKNEPLDMRYSLENNLTAEKIVNEWPEKEIEKILREFGEEKFAKQIARAIVKYRKNLPAGRQVKSTFELIDIIENAIPKFAFGKSKGPSNWANAQVGARSFQALRIAVNQELDNLREFLPGAIEVLSKGGRLAVISFHSLEDRIVKNFFREKEKLNQVKILTKKPIIASTQEIFLNKRARSAKLRVIIKN